MLYMTSYSGTKSRTFGVHENIQECKQEAENHALNNSRIKGKYTISEVDLICDNLYRTNLTSKIITGIKKGKQIEWNS